MNSSSPVLIGLGTNLGQRKKNLELARAELDRFCEKLEASSIIETKPVGISSKNDFLNQVVCLHAASFETPAATLKTLIELELKLGRDRKKNAPDRVIDLDLLYFGQQVCSSEPILPHPRLQERLFVLEPLVELVPDFRHPVFGKTQQQLLADLKKRKRVG